MIITFDNGLKIIDIREINITPPYIDYEDHNSEIRYNNAIMEIKFKNSVIASVALETLKETFPTIHTIIDTSNPTHKSVTVLNQQIIVINTETKTKTTIPYYNLTISPKIKVIFNDKQDYDRFLQAI